MRSRSVKFRIAETVADRIDRDVFLTHLALRRSVTAIIRKILNLVQGVDLLSEDLSWNGEDRRDAHNGSAVIVNALTCAKDSLTRGRGSQKQKDVLALDHHL